MLNVRVFTLGRFHNLLGEDGHVAALAAGHRRWQGVCFCLFFFVWLVFCMGTIAELNKIGILRVWEEGGVDIE